MIWENKRTEANRCGSKHIQTQLPALTVSGNSQELISLTLGAKLRDAREQRPDRNGPEQGLACTELSVRR